MKKTFVALLCGSLVCSALAEEEKPNIIILMTDDQGWGQTGYNGHPILKTPNLDAMASKGFTPEPPRIPLQLQEKGPQRPAPTLRPPPCVKGPKTTFF